MDEKNRQLFVRSDLGRFTFRERLTIRAADVVFYFAIRFIGATFRVETEGRSEVDSIIAAGRVPIFAIWHEHLFSTAYFFSKRKAVFLASQSRDGEYLARFLTRLGFGVVRGSSSRGGRQALADLGEAVRSGFSAVLMVDGPKGPPHEAKAGACVLAQRTGNPVVPVSIEPIRYRRVKSWDRMRIPMPFTRIRLHFGSPLEVGADDIVDEKNRELKLSLDELEQADKVWRESLN